MWSEGQAAPLCLLVALVNLTNIGYLNWGSDRGTLLKLGHWWKLFKINIIATLATIRLLLMVVWKFSYQIFQQQQQKYIYIYITLKAKLCLTCQDSKIEARKEFYLWGITQRKMTQCVSLWASQNKFFFKSKESKCQLYVNIFPKNV